MQSVSSDPADRGSIRPLRAASARVALAALFASCASYRSRPLVPIDELSALSSRTLELVQIERASGGLPPPPSVFDPEDGLDEAELVSVALTLNPGLRARRLEIGEASALLVQAGAWPNPELSVTALAGIDGAPAEGLGLDLLFELLRPGQRRARQDLARAEIETVRGEIAAEELRLAADARLARLAILSSEHAVRLLEQEAALRDEALALVREQRELGEATELDLVLVELERAAVQRELRRSRAELERERASLKALIGLPPTYELRLSDSGQALSFVLFEDPSDEELDARVLAGRSDLHARESAYRAAEEELRLAILEAYPRLELGPSFERDVEGNEGLGLGLALELPLFDRNRGTIAGKEAARERARAEYAALLFELRAGAFTARAALRRARSEVEIQQREVAPVIERSEALFTGAFRARELTVFEWITARSRALQAQRDLLAALVRHADAVVELEAATGSSLAHEPASRDRTESR